MVWPRSRQTCSGHWWVTPSHYIRNTQHLVEHIIFIQLKQGECISSYDVKTLFACVPVDPAISIFKQKLQWDSQLHRWTFMSIQHITTLLEFCLKNTYFLFQDKCYEQVHSSVMSSPTSPIVANLFMEEFESKVWAMTLICPGFGLGMLMTTLSSNRQNTASNYYVTSIPLTHTYCSPQRFLATMVPYHSWKLQSPQDLTTHSRWVPLKWYSS